MRTLTLAVAGAGPANRTQILDALNDWLGYGPEQPDGYFKSDEVQYDKINLFLPLTDEHFTDGVAAVYAWSSRADIDFTGILDQDEQPRSRDLKSAVRDARNLIPAPDIIPALIGQVAERAEQGDAYLLVFQDEDGGDKLADAAAREAFDAALPVLNLSFALAPIADPAAARTAKPSQIAEEAAAQLGAVTLTDTYVARLDLAFPLTADEKEVADFAFATLGQLVCYHNAQDTAQRAAHNAITEGEMSPLTASLIQATVALQRLLGHNGPIRLDPAPDAPAPAQAAEKIAPAAPVSRPGKTRKEWFDEASGEWRPVGRGRLRKDVQVREVPVEA